MRRGGETGLEWCDCDFVERGCAQKLNKSEKLKKFEKLDLEKPSRKFQNLKYFNQVT